MNEWRLEVAASAERSLSRLTESAAAAIVEFMLGPLLDAPSRVGKPLQRELTGYWSARRGAYRVIYRLDPDDEVVTVVRIEHRSDVYRRR
ncbi:MAG TPA: type II toxin-antitoxin system RelE/ParE family toxin [Acidimicrobiales bacterium]|nr:type II toxin-antitoxin system RelE/ParE family toxin [Acidimicrobiales bacterium]